MVSTIPDYLSNLVPSSRLEISGEIHLPLDLTSDRGTISIEADLSATAKNTGLGWSCQKGFELLPNNRLLYLIHLFDTPEALSSTIKTYDLDKLINR
jgi:hypothetical protein